MMALAIEFFPEPVLRQTFELEHVRAERHGFRAVHKFLVCHLELLGLNSKLLQSFFHFVVRTECPVQFPIFTGVIKVHREMKCSQRMSLNIDRRVDLQKKSHSASILSAFPAVTA